MATERQTDRNDRIVAMVASGKTFTETAAHFGVSRSLVAGVVARWGNKKKGDGPRSMKVIRAIEMRSSGMGWTDIAKRVGYAMPSAAYSVVKYWRA